MKKFSFLLIALCFSLLALADIQLPHLFGSNMVLQRNKPITVWGWASPGEKITVQFNKQVKKTKTAKDGSWKLELDQEAAGGPYQLIAKGKNIITLDNVLVGEVWICSGQSNMEWPVKLTDSAEREMKAADYSQIRHIKIPHVMETSPVKDFKEGEWEATTPATVGNFTAVGYYFARKLYNELHVPIGLINSSWGGTMVETWISKDALEKTEEFKDIFKEATFQEVEVAAAKRSEKVDPNNYPSLLFNGMINPLIPFSIRGAIWYQGETNAGRAFQYRKSFPLMIQDWRTRFKQGDFPFYFVQLASFNSDNGTTEKGSAWAELREAQTATLTFPNTGMAVTMDIGQSKDIHPRNKQDVGARLAAIALNDLYDKKMEKSGPVYESLKLDGPKALVSFTHADGLMAKDKYGYLKGFEIA
ncbi:MAG: sialate O-acetylesterase, partial [Flavitalea sp.]